jgi:hypothetical protein
VPAREFFDLQPKTIFRYPALELDGKEPVVVTGENTGRHVRPLIERKGCLEERLRGFLIAGLCKCGKHIGRQVMKEMSLCVKACIGVATFS